MLKPASASSSAATTTTTTTFSRKCSTVTSGSVAGENAASMSKTAQITPSPLITAHFPSNSMLEFGEHLGFYGPEGAWKIYEGQRRSTNEAVSMFIFEKRTAEKLHKPKRKGTITELYKKGFRQLERIQHTRFFHILFPLEETPDALLVVGEPVIGSLSDIIGNERISSYRTPERMTECPLLDLEIKCGLWQVTEGLVYLHSNEHCMHGNVCPESILVSSNGTWKLAGLEFAEKSQEHVDTFASIRWSSKFPKLGQPNLDFMAPEVQLQATCSTTSDLFSLGMTICAIYNQGKSLLQCNHNPVLYEAQLNELVLHNQEFVMQMPVTLQEAVEQLLQRDPHERPTAQTFAMMKYFTDPALTCLRRLEMLDQMFPSQKAEFCPILRDTMHAIPRKLWQSRVLPALMRDLANEDFAPYAIYPLSYMIEHSDKLDYAEIYRPSLEHVFHQVDKSPQTQVILLRNLSTFAKFAPPDEILRLLVPLLENALESHNPEILEAGVLCFGKFYAIIRDEATKFHLFHSLKSLLAKRTDYSIKVQAALIGSLEKVVDHLSKSFVLDEVIPTLAEERLSYSIDCLNPLIDFYRHILKDVRFAVTPEIITRFVLPTVLPLLTHPDLTKDQFVNIDILVKDLLSQVEKKQRTKFKLEAPPILSPPSANGAFAPSSHHNGGTSSGNSSRRNSLNVNGGPYITFTTGDSATSSRSSSPTRSRRSSYIPHPNSRPKAASTMYLNVDDHNGNISRSSPVSPERRGSFLNFQGFPPGLNASQRRHSAVTIQAIGNQMVSLFAGRS